MNEIIKREKILEILIEYGKQNNNDIDLSNLDLSYFNLNLSSIKADKIDNSIQTAKEIDNCHQIADNINNTFQDAYVIDNSEQKAQRIDNYNQFQRKVLVPNNKVYELKLSDFVDILWDFDYGQSDANKIINELHLSKNDNLLLKIDKGIESVTLSYIEGLISVFNNTLDTNYSRNNLFIESDNARVSNRFSKYTNIKCNI